jgi:hypothetical protein
MVFKVKGKKNKTPFDQNALNTGITAAYVASQAQPIVPQTTYPPPFQAAADSYAHIQDNTLTYTPVAAAEHGGRIDDSGDLLRIDIQVADGSTFDSTQPSDGLVQVDGALGHVDQSLAGFLPVVSESAPAPIVFWF